MGVEQLARMFTGGERF